MARRLRKYLKKQRKQFRRAYKYSRRRQGGLYYTPKPNVMYKYVDSTISGNAAYDQPPQLLNGIALGSENNNRIGRKVLLKSLYLRLFISKVAGTAQNYSFPVRILIVYDRQTNGAAPALSDILSSATGAAVESPNNLNNVDRFYTCYDITREVQVTGGNSTNYTFTGVYMTKYCKLNLPQTFKSSAGTTVSDIATGSMYLFAIADSTAATAICSVAGIARLRFCD